MKKNLIAETSFTFALKTVSLCKTLLADKEFVISNQLLKSSTSIGANVEEALAAFSRKEFAYKISIALREARETRYWLRLLSESGLTTINLSDHLFEIEKIINILSKILISTKNIDPTNNNH